jgi:hypothetical protein
MWKLHQGTHTARKEQPTTCDSQHSTQNDLLSNVLITYHKIVSAIASFHQRFHLSCINVMAPQFPSIQSFFTTSEPNIATPKRVEADASPVPRDGFTDAEIDAVLNPTSDNNWLPVQEYDQEDIISLIPGPRCVTFQGRVANFYDQATPSKKPRAAKGCVKLIIKDDTGAITVRVMKWDENEHD